MSPILALEPGLSATTAVASHATFVISNDKESIQSANGQTWRLFEKYGFEYALGFAALEQLISLKGIDPATASFFYDEFFFR